MQRMFDQNPKLKHPMVHSKHINNAKQMLCGNKKFIA